MFGSILMSTDISWYPRTAKEKMNFFWRSFPMFVLLIILLYFGLDWLGAFEFLEILVRDNSKWLLITIWGYDPEQINANFFQRVDQDPLTNGLIFFGAPYFPGIKLDTYPRVLLIIRACTGMEAGALLMALILVTPAKWENKLGASITNFLMMHIGNTFRVAFHFWYTQHLYQKYISSGIDSITAADKAFAIAHDSLSKVFGFVGIVIFTLVIERIGVRIVMTFSAWIDASIEGFKRITNKVYTNAHYFNHTISYEDLAQSDEKIPLRVEQLNKKSFYPMDEIQKNQWNSFIKSFKPFILITLLSLVTFGFIPYISQGIGISSDYLATNFGAIINSSNSHLLFWWKSIVDQVTQKNFVINIASSGVLLFSVLVGVLVVTPGKRKRKGVAIGTTPLLLFPLNILRFGFQKWATWKLADSNLGNNRPLLYLNLADVVKTFIPILFWISILILLLKIYSWLEVKAFSIIWAWLHQITLYLGLVLGLRKKPESTLISTASSEITN